MEPVSVLGLVGTALSVAKAISQIISQLSELKSRLRNVPIHLLTLLNQLHIVRAALKQISRWNSENLWSNPRYAELAEQIDTSLDCFAPLIFTLQQHLDKLKLPQDLNLSTKQKMIFLWNEKDILTFLHLLDCQVNALNLVLQAVQCQTLTEQRTFVNDTRSRTILQKAKDCSSSIIGTPDTPRIFSECTDSDHVDTVDLRQFDIDAMHRYKPRGNTAVSADKQDSGQTHGTPTRASQQEAHRSTSVQVIFAIGSVLWWICFILWWLLWGVAVAVRFGLGLSHRTTTPREGAIPRQIQLHRPSATEKRRILDKVLTSATEDPLPAAILPTEVKLLLLGISDSGKSTLLERMRLCTNGEHSFDKAASYTRTICSNISHGLRAVIQAVDHLGLSLEHRGNYQHARNVYEKPAFLQGPRLSDDLGAALKELWADSGFQEAFRRRRECPLELRQIESLPYFASHVERLTASGYVPTPEDILRSRVLTTGVHETRLEAGTNLTARVLDVGGLRSEREKWSNCFDDVDCVVFTV